MDTAVGRLGAFLVLCLIALVPSCSSDGDDSDEPGSGGSQEPPAPENVAMFRSRSGPPAFEVRWVAPDSKVAIASFTVYESDQQFEDRGQATVVALKPGTSRSAEVELRPDTGVRHFRVSALSADNVEGPLSAELAIDTASRLFFIADRTVNEAFEAFSTDATAAANPKNLSGGLVLGGDVERMFPSPDGRRAAFIADKDADGFLEVYVAPLDASSPPVKVSGTFVFGGKLQPFQVAWSPEGRRLAFSGDKVTPGAVELFVTPADGSSAPVRVSGPGGDVGDFAWSPEGTRIAFLSDKDQNTVRELFVITSGTSKPVKVSGTLVAGGQVESFAWSPDGQHLAMRASKVTAGVEEIFVADPAGETEPIKVSGTLLAFSSIDSDPLWSPDSTRLLFTGDLLSNSVVELFVTAADGSALPQRVSGSAQAFSEVVDFQWSPDGQRVAFIMDKNFQDAHEVFVAVPLSGIEPVRVSGAFASGSNASNVQWSPRGTLLAYLADASVNDQFELFLADPNTADSAVHGSGDLDANADVLQFAWSPDGSRLAMVGDLDTDEVSELFITPLASLGTLAKVSGAMITGGNVSDTFFGWAPLSN